MVYLFKCLLDVTEEEASPLSAISANVVHMLSMSLSMVEESYHHGSHHHVTHTCYRKLAKMLCASYATTCTYTLNKA